VALFTQDTKVQALKRAPLFEGLSKKELTQLARVSEDIELREGQILCKEGEIGHEFFVILDGKADVTRKGKKVTQRGGGEFIGEIALVDEVPRTATVTAKTPMRAFVLTSTDFHHLLEEHPGIQNKVLRALARRIAELSQDPTDA
jgi:CRP-like cAMP-binding protein